MAGSNINTVVITGNLTKDPELRSTPGGTSVCKLRVAVNSRRKDGQSGEWVDKPNYFDVTVWGAQGENCANYLSKGRPVAVEGRLDWREWDAQDGSKRQAVEIIANSVQFLGSRSDNREQRWRWQRLPAQVRCARRHLGLRGRRGQLGRQLGRRHPVLGPPRDRCREVVRDRDDLVQPGAIERLPHSCRRADDREASTGLCGPNVTGRNRPHAA